MNKLIRCHQGNMPLIITVPHGGALVPQNIPSRDFGSYKKDKNTTLAAKEILNVFKKHGLEPYIIIMTLHRRKIDVNRGSKEGAQHSGMLTVYKEYHNIIKEWRHKLQKKYGYCLLVDLHGQKEKRGFIEIGYGLTKEHLSSLDSLDEEELKKHSSLRYLIERKNKAKDIIIGPESFGSILAGYDYKVFPSHDCQHIEEIHYNGVYTLHRHVVKRNKEKMIGLNLELGFEGIRDTEAHRQQFAKAFYKTVIKYLKIYFGNNQKWLQKR